MDVAGGSDVQAVDAVGDDVQLPAAGAAAVDGGGANFRRGGNIGLRAYRFGLSIAGLLENTDNVFMATHNVVTALQPRGA